MFELWIDKFNGITTIDIVIFGKVVTITFTTE